MLRKRDIPYRKPVISFFLLAETWRYGPATWPVFLCFRLFPLLLKYVQKVSYLRKSGFPMGIFLYSYMKLTFEYFSWLTYMQWRLVHYISQTNIYHHKTEIHPCCIWNFIPFPAHIDSYQTMLIYGPISYAEVARDETDLSNFTFQSSLQNTDTRYFVLWNQTIELNQNATYSAAYLCETSIHPLPLLRCSHCTN